MNEFDIDQEFSRDNLCVVRANKSSAYYDLALAIFLGLKLIARAIMYHADRTRPKN